MINQTKRKSGLLTHSFFINYRYDFFIGIGLFIILFFLYESMAPVRLSSSNYGSDGGDFLAAVLTNGIPHPTGYPLYLILAEFAQLLPYNTPVWRQVQLSIIPAIISILLFYVLLPKISSSEISIKQCYRVPCVLVSISLGLSSIYWSQAVIIEVYALNILFFIISLLWVSIVLTTPTNQIGEKTKFICFVSWIGGLGLGNHTSIILIYPIISLCLYRLWNSFRSKKWIFLCTIGWLSGLLFYLLLPYRAFSLPIVSWGDARTLEGFFWLIRGGDYRQYLFAIQPAEYLQRISSLCGVLLNEFSFIGITIGLIGLFFYKTDYSLRIISIYLFISYAIIAISYKTVDSLVYCIPSVVCFAIWIYWGLVLLWNKKILSLNIGMISSFVMLAFSLTSISTRYANIDPRSYNLSNYAETVLSQSRPGEVVFPNSDGETFALWYHQYGLGIRRDVVILSKGLMRYPWYREQVKRLYPDFDIFSETWSNHDYLME